MKSFKGKPLRNILTIFSRKPKTWQRCGLFLSYLFAERRWRSVSYCVRTLWIFAKTTRLLLKMNLNKCLAPWIASRLPLVVTLKKLNELRKWKQFQGNRWRDPDKKKGAEKEKRGTILFQKMEERIQTILEAAGRAVANINRDPALRSLLGYAAPGGTEVQLRVAWSNRLNHMSHVIQRMSTKNVKNRFS